MDYQLIIKIPFEAMDDMAARQKAKDILADLQDNLGDMDDLDKSIKLQNIFNDSPPRGIPL